MSEGKNLIHTDDPVCLHAEKVSPRAVNHQLTQLVEQLLRRENLGAVQLHLAGQRPAEVQGDTLLGKRVAARRGKMPEQLAALLILHYFQ